MMKSGHKPQLRSLWPNDILRYANKEFFLDKVPCQIQIPKKLVNTYYNNRCSH